jgi:hypothetical protein
MRENTVYIDEVELRTSLVPRFWEFERSSQTPERMRAGEILIFRFTGPEGECPIGP